MKYAFIFGTSAFIVPQGVITYANEDTTKEILHIRSLYNNTQPESYLGVDIDISDSLGSYVRISNSKAESEGSYKVESGHDFVKVLNSDGSLLIHVHQLDHEIAMGLEHNITAELEVNSPVTAIRINGDFMAEGIHIVAENEKLHVNSDDWATAALAGNSLRFTADGVVI